MQRKDAAINTEDNMMLLSNTFDDDAFDWHIRVYQRRVQNELCERFDLIPARDAASFHAHDRAKIEALCRTLPEYREIEPQDRDMDELMERHDLCGDWGLVPGERYRLDAFVLRLARVELERRLGAGGRAAA